MLPLPPFTLHSPALLREAFDLLAEHGRDAVLVAGGTDLLPNMKHGLVAPRHIVSLRRVEELAGVRRSEDALRIGAMTTLDAIAKDAAVREIAPALAEAARSVGGPHHRRMGTLGGNLCLDTRCRYFNQTAFWREALGHCIKKDGTACHVVAGGKRCVAAASNDTAAAAIALGAEIVLARASGERVVAARDFWTADGVANNVRRAEEIVVELRVPIVRGRRSAYEKLRRRASIDFPLLSVAASADVRDDRVEALELVVSALASKPKRVASASPLAIGRARADIDVATIGRAAWGECHPLANLDADATWRRDMVPVLVARVLARVLA
jgi:4-hydroxybenzoyl-CoA reductase subunit beta